MKKHRQTQPFQRPGIALAALSLTAALFVCACGRKGPLRLEPRPEPTAIADFQIRQIGAVIELSWMFPPVLGDGTTAFDPGEVSWVRCFHSDRHLKDGQFQRRAEALRKITLDELEKQGLTYRLRIPFATAELTGKKHFFSLMYAYRRQKSPLAPVQEFSSDLPAAGVAGLQITQEEKALRLDWKRPTGNLAGKPLSRITGYVLYRRILPADETEADPAFVPVTKEPILQEKYEDTDTSLEGRYEYRVAALLSARIESAPSDTVKITMVDKYPPDIPSGMVVFRARDHLLINWLAVKDSDLSHYRIYRRADQEEEFVLLVDRVTEPHYEDRSVKAGQTYHYQVTAVDIRGNESLPSQAGKEAF
ncbi:MAG: fibronectin type III domain-containing protein [Acidobacteriota bacterium]|jgi:hypothetical protein|nr:fibronectin type III domain-containing protein [Acidobacteriota bacterium]